MPDMPSERNVHSNHDEGNLFDVVKYSIIIVGRIKRLVCPSIGLPLIKRVLYNFTPDEFCPDADTVPGAVLEALNAEIETASIHCVVQDAIKSIKKLTLMLFTGVCSSEKWVQLYPIIPNTVCIPFSAQGHITPIMQFAKLLYSRGFYISFINTEFNHRCLLQLMGPDVLSSIPDFCYETIPNGLPPSDRDATQDLPSLADSTRKYCLVPLVDLIGKLNALFDVPQVTFIVSEGVMDFGIIAA
ncbi:hypothetical protein GIB67_031379 [Kingdonia uniflora]|uniref:UDP-glycosyltransferase n=1 Tax=Kingdonia uniflora TaxID=39325 RepID=A0A7J7MB02_9MAGN|nr:hypothetical protein GIB67_031379 [Kingdonia uniflora]